MSVDKVVSRGEVFYIKSGLQEAVGSEQKSGRPAVVVSNNTCNKYSPTVEICYLTLQEKPPLPTHVTIDKGACINSTILCEQITTVSVNRLGDFMCRLPDYTMDEVDRALAISIGIDYLFENSEETSSDVDQIRALKAEIASLSRQVDEAGKELAATKMKAEKAEMFEKMYNDIIDRLVGR